MKKIDFSDPLTYTSIAAIGKNLANGELGSLNPLKIVKSAVWGADAGDGLVHQVAESVGDIFLPFKRISSAVKSVANISQGDSWEGLFYGVTALTGLSTPKIIKICSKLGLKTGGAVIARNSARGLGTEMRPLVRPFQRGLA